ncbi:MAG: TGS domain-containing protein, partial [Ruminococcaceae bacterium]|nr:TGS domain-containing protein [Oscillospiraceae bacterium]
MIKVYLPDGACLELEDGATCLDAAKAISSGLARAAFAAELDGKAVELMEPVYDGAKIAILTSGEDALHTMRHTASHVMAQAIQHLYPDAKFAIGPAISTGFYYDIDCPTTFTAEDLKKIEAEMKKIIKQGIPLQRFTMPRDEALAYFKEKNEPYKVELIEDLPEDAEISFYKQGDFTDLCAGPHLPDTSRVKAFQ